MKNKQTQFEKNLVKNAEKIMQWMEESGQVELQRKLMDAFYKATGKWDGKPIGTDPMSSWTPEAIKAHESWQKNVRPKWKASKKIQNILDGFLNSPANGRSYNDILLEIEKITESERDKDNTKPKTGQYDGASYNQKKKFIRISKRYEKLKETKTPTRARNMIMQKEKISLSTFTKYLTKGNKLRKK